MNTNEQTIHQMGFGISSLVKQATGRESVSNIEMDWVSVEQLARYIYGSGTGDLVSFDTNIPDAIESLIAYITAVQNLHGYDNPWPVGGGVNKSLYTVDSIKTATGGTWTGNTTTINDIEFTILTDAAGNVTGINVNGTASGTAVLILYDTSVNPFTENVRYRVNGLWADGSAETFKHDILYGNSIAVVDIAKTEGSNFTVTADIAAATRIRERLVIYTGVSLDNVKFYPMIAVFSDTVADFVPPSNFCPITGWTGCNVTRCGINLLDPVHYETFIFGSATRYGKTFGPGTYTIINNWESGKSVYYRKVSASSGTVVLPGNKATVTTTENMMVYSELAANLPGFCVRNDGGDTYEEYQGETYAFTFPDEAGTVYGATLDVLTGVLTVDMAYIKGRNCTWSANANYQNTFNGLHTLGSAVDNNTTGLSSAYIQYTSGSVASHDYGFATSNNNTKTIYVKNKDYSSLSDFVNHIADVEFVWRLRTPITYQLTAQEVTALIGENNIFADTGNVSVQYKVKEDLV